MDGGAWWVAVHRVTKSLTGLSDFTHSLMKFWRHIYLIELLLLALTFFQLIYILKKYDFVNVL